MRGQSRNRRGVLGGAWRHGLRTGRGVEADAAELVALAVYLVVLVALAGELRERGLGAVDWSLLGRRAAVDVATSRPAGALVELRACHRRRPVTTGFA